MKLDIMMLINNENLCARCLPALILSGDAGKERGGKEKFNAVSA
jgi:hypothetical protein